MTTEKYFSFIVNSIHTTVVATLDDDGLPVTSAIDMTECPAEAIEWRRL